MGYLRQTARTKRLRVALNGSLIALALAAVILAGAILGGCGTLGAGGSAGGGGSAGSGDGTALTAYQDVRHKDLSQSDLRRQAKVLQTLTFDTTTRWPAANRLPAGFSPKALLEFGKDPGLGIKTLHAQGLTGKGVRIAYIDQPLSLKHDAYKDRNIHYYMIRPEERGMDASMHGPAVASLLVGTEIGVAPDAEVYFFGHPAWLLDQTTHAEALHKLLEVNASLPADAKIRAVGFSDAPDPREKNIEAYQAALREAEAQGVMVFDVLTWRMVGVTVPFGKDKDDPNNYEVTHWAAGPLSPDSFLVPTSARTTAVSAPAGTPGANPSEDTYAYWTEGGLSWGVPYVLGTVALGLQIDPTLTKAQILSYFKESAYPFHGARLINPTGFIRLVQQNKGK